MQFARLCGLVMTGLKKTPREIGGLYMTDVYEVLDAWEEHPPTFILLRGLIPWERPKRATMEDCAEVAALFARRN